MTPSARSIIDATCDAASSGSKSAIQTKGTFKVTFKKKGTVKLACDVHPGMTGSVKVK